MISNLDANDCFNFMPAHDNMEQDTEGYLAPVTKLPAKNKYECGFIKASETFTSILNHLTLNAELREQISLFLRAITAPEGLRGIGKTTAKFCLTVQVFALGLDNICKNRRPFGFAKYIVEDTAAGIDEEGRGPKYSLNSYIYYVTATETGLVGHPTNYLSLYRTADWCGNREKKSALYATAKNVMCDFISTVVDLSRQTTPGAVPVPVLQLLVRCRNVLVDMNASSSGFDSCVKQSITLLAYILHQFGLDYQLFSGRLTNKMLEFDGTDLSDIAIPNWLTGTELPVNKIKAVLHFDRDAMSIDFGNNLKAAFDTHFPAV